MSDFIDRQRLEAQRLQPPNLTEAEASLGYDIAKGTDPLRPHVPRGPDWVAPVYNWVARAILAGRIPNVTYPAPKE